ncbi:hypothetical protein PR202_ga28483 [Eleusine coracana subsp. coracana]|uniref:F-box domain-containing protein n=1 Tax=Eleusine coracana subsp. coracana TaxID=191504 RepID=A0AAV5DJJ0_ELECO|nr:hypothetical protein PR202_ga28483 [Eleusine coracana subsp. coracana]
MDLIDDVAAEIFLRLPPDEPEHLVRASLVCKLWFRLISDPGFLRRYRAFHRTPPLLGFMQRRRVIERDPEPCLIPTTAAHLAPNPSFRRARFLLHGAGKGWNFVVWDPVTGDRKFVPSADIDWLIYSAAVFCAVKGGDHLDCHGGPFVVFIATDDSDDHVKAGYYGRYYTPYVQPRRGAVIGDEIYFTLLDADAIVKYDLRKNCLSMIEPPTWRAHNLALMEMEDSSLGFACIEGSGLYLWSRKVNSKGAAEWLQFRVIEHVTMRIPVDKAYVVGAAEGVCVIFVSTGAGLFTIEVNSGQVKKIAEPEVYFSILPYMSFYTPDCGATKAKYSTDI